MKFEAKMIEDSISPSGVRLSTMQLCYPRFVHAEFMTHRVFSRNASSSRAIPVEKMIQQVRNAPAKPVHWGANQKGMQAHQELDAAGKDYALDLWIAAAFHAASIAERMAVLGLHKQVANRILEPFQWMHVIVTATEWNNFFELRDHADAEPNIRLLAQLMETAMSESEPVFRGTDTTEESSWHLPYVTKDERAHWEDRPEVLAQISAARCARVSYLTHDGQRPNYQKDLALYDRLVGSRPLHASPVEHQAWPMPFGMGDGFSGNFRGWHQFRKQIEAEMES